MVNEPPVASCNKLLLFCHIINRPQIHSSGLVSLLALCFPRLLELKWCSFAVNLHVVTKGGARGFTLRSYGEGVCGGAPVSLPSIGRLSQYGGMKTAS